MMALVIFITVLSRTVPHEMVPIITRFDTVFRPRHIQNTVWEGGQTPYEYLPTPDEYMTAIIPDNPVTEVFYRRTFSILELEPYDQKRSELTIVRAWLAYGNWTGTSLVDCFHTRSGPFRTSCVHSTILN